VVGRFHPSDSPTQPVPSTVNNGFGQFFNGLVNGYRIAVLKRHLANVAHITQFTINYNSSSSFQNLGSYAICNGSTLTFDVLTVPKAWIQGRAYKGESEVSRLDALSYQLW